MEGLLQYIETNLPFIITHKYLLLFLGAVLEGMNSMILGGFLISVGNIKFIPTFFMFLGGYVINGYIWYAVGYFGGSKPLDKWVRKDEKGKKILGSVEHYFERYSGRAIIFTKFTFSLTIATLITAGSLKYNLKKFTYYNFWGSVGWVAVTLFIGFFFGESFKLIFTNFLRNLTYFIVSVGGAVALVYAIKFTLKSAFIKSLMLRERFRSFSDKLKGGLDKWLYNGSVNDHRKDQNDESRDV